MKDEIVDQPKRLIDGDSNYRKSFPLCRGLLDYFPDALAAVAHGSYVGSLKHNGDTPMMHARGKSMDHADCIVRHLMQRGGFDFIVINGVEFRVRHSAWVAWRALALLQDEIERDKGTTIPRGASE